MQAVNDHNLVPGYKLLRSGKQPDSEVVDSLGRKVDSALFPTSRVRTDQTPNWPDQIIPFVWKIDHPTNDVFVDLEDKSVQCLDHRELAAYLELLFQVQQRTAVFMFFIIGRKFRLLRWDRSGAIVSDAVDYYLHWEVLCEVFRRISFLSDEQLGFDATAMRLSPGDGDHEKMDNYAKSRKEDISHLEETSVQLVGDVVPIFEYVRGAFRQSLHPHWPRYRVQVPDGKIMRSFLIGKPVIAAKGMVGRGTRGYIALDCHTWGFVWLKDAWRAHCLIVDKEGDILKALNDANVPNVPTLICHGDLPGQDTVTPSWWEQKYPRKEANSDQPEPTLDQPNNSQAAFNQGDLEPSAASKDDDGELVPFFDRAEGAPSGESTFDKGDDDYYGAPTPPMFPIDALKLTNVVKNTLFIQRPLPDQRGNGPKNTKSRRVKQRRQRRSWTVRWIPMAGQARAHVPALGQRKTRLRAYLTRALMSRHIARTVLCAPIVTIEALSLRLACLSADSLMADSWLRSSLIV